MYVSDKCLVVSDPAPVVVPANSKELFAKLDAAERAMVPSDVAKLETIHELCRAYRAVDEDAFGEAAERLVFHGAHGTPGVAEYLSLEISALLAISPGAGACLIGQVLNCAHRHPLLWDAVRDGAVLPILHLNGYKIANPTLLARIPEEQLMDLMRGNGYEPHLVSGDDPGAVHQRMATVMDTCLDEIARLQSEARGGPHLSTSGGR